MNWLARGLILLVVLLICSGGFVTACGAGMAIPDWPRTFGYWVYPPQRWLGRLDDPMLKQVHRILAQLALVWGIGLAVVLWRSDARRDVRLLGLAASFGVIAQGVLGGLRVLGDSVPVAGMHAAMAPLVLSLYTAIAVVTSNCWLAAKPPKRHRNTKAMRFWCLAALSLVYLLVVTVAQIRHVPPTAGLSWVPSRVSSMAVLAALALITAGQLSLLARRHFEDCPLTARRIGWFVGLLAAHVLLIGGVRVTNYGWPPWFTDYVFPIRYTVVSSGPLQAATTTASVTAGALAAAVGVNAAMWTFRGLRSTREQTRRV